MQQSGFFFSLCASRMISVVLLTLVKCPCWQLFGLLPFCVHCCFRIQDFSSLEASEQTCAPNGSDLSSCALSPRCDLHDLLVQSIPNVFSWIHKLSRCMHALPFGFSLDSLVALAVSCSFFERCFAPILQGTAAFI